MYVRCVLLRAISLTTTYKRYKPTLHVYQLLYMTFVTTVQPVSTTIDGTTSAPQTTKQATITMIQTMTDVRTTGIPTTSYASTSQPTNAATVTAITHGLFYCIYIESLIVDIGYIRF